MFGTVNLDMRSLWLNYEVALFVYGAAFAEELYSLQQSYLDDCECVDPRGVVESPRQSAFYREYPALFGPSCRSNDVARTGGGAWAGTNY